MVMNLLSKLRFWKKKDEGKLVEELPSSTRIEPSSTSMPEKDLKEDYTIKGKEGILVGGGIVAMASELKRYNDQLVLLSEKVATKDMIQEEFFDLYGKLEALRGTLRVSELPEIDEIEKKVISLEITLSDRLKEALRILEEKKNITPKDLAEKMMIKENTACEYLGKLVKVGKARKVSRGVYGEHI
jgi:hypothetical protein